MNNMREFGQSTEERRLNMTESINARLSKPIVEILKKGEHTTAEIQNEIRWWYKELYLAINEILLKEGRQSTFDKCVDGALQSLKGKGTVERSSSEHGGPWRLV